MDSLLKKLFSLFPGLGLALVIAIPAQAQYESYYQEGEFGFQLGAAHYFGDLNTQTGLRRPQPALGIFFRKQLNNYTAIRVAANYARLTYSDHLQPNSEFQRRRNLSFETSIWELLVQGDFNFFRFNPTNPNERFTPYLTFGVGFFYYDPFARLNGEKYYLRPLGTEGQASALYPERKAYSSVALAVPFGMGVKWAVNPNMNLHFEITHRFTGTDYIDDVSGTYAGLTAFSPSSPAWLLQDRSYETGPRIGAAGAQRGFSGNKDQYITATIGVSFNIISYKCPSGN